jgi:hypothetical protein
MTDEHRLIREIDRGQQARIVIDSPIYREAIDGLREQLMAEWRDTTGRDTQGREQLWLAQNLLQRIEAHLAQVMTTGQMASLQLEQKRSVASRAVDWMQGRWE